LIGRNRKRYAKPLSLQKYRFCIRCI